MVRKNFTPEQIINKLREAEILLSQYRRKIVRLANNCWVIGLLSYLRA